jgi:hypothetical protein
VKRDEPIPATFIRKAAAILGETTRGLSGSTIIDETSSHAADHDVDIPYTSSIPMGMNKRTALYNNLEPFPPAALYCVLKALCEHRSFEGYDYPELGAFKTELVLKFSHLDPRSEESALDQSLVDEAKHYLQSHPRAHTAFSAALTKYDHGAFHRNLLDDLRLALEQLLRDVLKNNRSLENQIAEFGSFVKSRGGSPEFRNMFQKLLKYYTDYQNSYVKHDDAVVEHEVEFIFEITASFMKQVVRLTHLPPVNSQ